MRDEGVMFDEYAYDQNGNVSSITDLEQGVTTCSMAYDALDRLYEATANGAGMWGTASYANDALDDIRGVVVASGANARSLTLNYDVTKRLTSITGTTALNLTYDSQGNLATRGGEQFIFDKGNRLSSVVGKANYVYDGWGRRVKAAKADGTAVIQVYSKDGQLLYGTSSAGGGTPIESRYVYLNGRLLADAGVAWTHTDGLGSPVARTDSARTVLSRTRYEPYGVTVSGTVPTSIGFTGHVNDVDTTLVYMQQRYYDPLVGRFLSIDPVTTDKNTGKSFNQYIYGRNNPYAYIDPDGRADCRTDGNGCKHYGTAQKTGGVGHDTASIKVGEQYSSQGATEVHYNRALSTVTGNPAAGLQRPDVTAVFPNSSVSTVEITSPSQTTSSQEVKGQNMQAKLSSIGRGGNANTLSISQGMSGATVRGIGALGMIGYIIRAYELDGIGAEAGKSVPLPVSLNYIGGAIDRDQVLEAIGGPNS